MAITYHQIVQPIVATSYDEPKIPRPCGQGSVGVFTPHAISQHPAAFVVVSKATAQAQIALELELIGEGVEPTQTGARLAKALSESEPDVGDGEGDPA